MIYHITTRRAWRAAQEGGSYEAESLASEGFIHCSTRAQLLGVANSIYRGRQDLIVLCLDETALDAELRWEAPAHPPGSDWPQSVEEALFPHIYGAITLNAVVEVLPLREGEDGFVMPRDLPR